MSNTEDTVFFTAWEKAEEYAKKLKEEAHQQALKDMEEEDFIPTGPDPDMDIILEDEDD